MQFGHRKPALSPEDVYQAKVVVNTALRTDEQERQTVIVIPRKKSPLISFLAFFLSTPKEKKVVLDELGSEVFRYCRQELTVSEIVARFGQKHNFSPEYSRQNVLVYLRTLAQRGIIGFLMKERKNG